MPLEKYNIVITKLNAIRDAINKAQAEIDAINADREGDLPSRIVKLEEQLEKIDEYMLKIKAFQDLAKRNMKSLNVQTIDAPPGYRVNLNRLRNWAMMIDPTSSDDPYAQRIYVTARCDEFFLEKKKKEFTKKLEQLKNDRETGATEAIRQLELTIDENEAKLSAFADSGEMADLAQAVVNRNKLFWNETAPSEFANVIVSAGSTAPGAYALPLPFGERQKEKLKELMGKFYDDVNGRVLIPFELESEKEFILNITCTASRSKQLDKGLQNFILNQINGSEAGLRKVFVLDGMRYNSASIGSLKQLEDSFALGQIPRNPEQMTNLLEKMVSDLTDTDDLIEMCDSVVEYNRTAEKGKKLPLTTVVLYGWPNSFSTRDKELLSRIMTNYERYGYSFITVGYVTNEKQKATLSMPEYALSNAVSISMLRKETKISFGEENEYRFTWYALGENLPESYGETLRAHKITKDAIGNEYPKRYPLNESWQKYARHYKKLELPVGIDGKDKEHTISFENENFAAYLMGASRSGKSTLIHTIIAGLVRNYHPDNLELWLADFKQLEFKRYIKHCPPHVKYVLLDESTELVYDLVDKLTEEMLERQKIFAIKGVQRIDQIDPLTLSKPMPIIFVILDEFSIMSQSIAESSVYKLRLQNILAKGAALGIRFIFASQTFTTGVGGLTSTARAQIQQRIAMKASKEEISETLELSSSLKTDQVRNWIDALPPHYALIKHRKGADSQPEVQRLYTMYIPDYKVRDDMIDDINENMHSVESYAPHDMLSFVEKSPVLVDGNTFEAFDEKSFMDEVAKYKKVNASDLVGDETFITFGTPRRMVSMKLSALSNETRENILLIGRQAEQATSASVLLSAMRAYKLQGGKVQIWAYGKNRLFRAYKSTFQHFGFEIIEDIDAVCDEIRALKKKMENRETDNRLIAMIGIDRICMDFGFVDGGSAKADAAEISAEIKKVTSNEAALVKTNIEALKQQFAAVWMTRKSELEAKFKAEGLSDDETKAKLKEERMKLRAEMGIDAPQPAAAPQPAPQPAKVEEAPKQEKKDTGAYDASADLIYILKQGSRLGYHFMLQLNSIEDIKTTGLNVDYFRYRLGFTMSADDSRAVFGTKIASTLPERICQYDDKLDSYSFRPYLHKDTSWDGWYTDENGKAISPFEA